MRNLVAHRNQILLVRATKSKILSLLKEAFAYKANQILLVRATQSKILKADCSSSLKTLFL